MSASPFRSVITIVMNVLIVLAIAVAARIVVVFFGALEVQSWAQALIKLTNLTVIPFGVEELTTPYGGVFDVDAALTVGVFLLAEWGLDFMKGRV